MTIVGFDEQAVVVQTSGRKNVSHLRQDFHRLYIRLDEPKKPTPKIAPTAMIPVPSETIDADALRDQLTPKQAARMDKHLENRMPKKFTPKDKTPFLTELQQEVVPRLEEFQAMLSQTHLSKEPISPLRVLSIDPGISNIAICFIDRENGQHMTSKIIIPESLTLASVRLRYLDHILEQWIRFFRPDMVFVEGVAHLSRNGVSGAGKREYVVERMCMEYGIPFAVIPTMRMRAFVGASGKEDNKSDIKLKVFQKFNAEFNSEDECEAFAIAQTGIAILEKTWKPPSVVKEEKTLARKAAKKK